MTIDITIIFNVCLGMLLYNLIIASIAKVLFKYFLDNSEIIQSEKKSFREKLKDKMKEPYNDKE